MPIVCLLFVECLMHSEIWCTNNICQSFGESNLETIAMINGTVVNLPNHIFMKSGKYQIAAVVTVFSLGFMSHDFISDGPVVDDAYYRDTSELLQCTINLIAIILTTGVCSFQRRGFTEYVSTRIP